MENKIWWHSHDHYSPNLSKASLGEFFYVVLSSGAEVGKIWPFAPQYQRSSVFISIKATQAQKERIEATTKFRFKLPPKIHLNSE